MTINDGGPAFPVECSYNGNGKAVGLQTSVAGGWETGMSLRDYFAAQAIIHIATITPVEVAAKMAYALADAMLVARTPQEITDHD